MSRLIPTTRPSAGPRGSIELPRGQYRFATSRFASASAYHGSPDAVAASRCIFERRQPTLSSSISKEAAVSDLPLQGRVAVVAGAQRGAPGAASRACWARRVRHRVLHGAQRQAASPPPLGARRPWRRLRNWSRPKEAGASPSAPTTRSSPRSSNSSPAFTREVGPARHPGQRHLGRRRAHRVGNTLLGTVNGEGDGVAPARRPHAHHHQPARRAADGRARRRAHRRGHGWRHLRLPRQPLLRPCEERGRSVSPTPWPPTSTPTA